MVYILISLILLALPRASFAEPSFSSETDFGFASADKADGSFYRVAVSARDKDICSACSLGIATFMFGSEENSYYRLSSGLQASYFWQSRYRFSGFIGYYKSSQDELAYSSGTEYGLTYQRVFYPRKKVRFGVGSLLTVRKEQTSALLKQTRGIFSQVSIQL